MQIEQLLPSQSIQHCKNTYLNYLQASPVDASIKDFLSRPQVFQNNFDIYPYYPYLFRNYFPGLSDEKLSTLSAAGYLYYLSLISMDRLMDAKEGKFDLKNLVIINFCQEESVKLLSSLFDLEHEFWQYWYQRKQEQQRSILMEKSLSHESLIPIEQYEKIAIAKSAVAKVALDCNYLGHQNRRTEQYEQLVKSHDYFSIALQVIDDLQDLEEDIENQQYNLAFSILQKHCEAVSLEVSTLVSRGECKKYLYFHGLYKEMYQLAFNYLHKAEKALTDLEESGWKRLIQAYRKSLSTKLDRTEGYFKILRLQASMQTRAPLHIAPKLQAASLREAKRLFIQNGIHFLLDQWQRGYPDLAHIMYLSQEEGFSKEDGLYLGDVFQRAIVGDVLCDLVEQWSMDWSAIFSIEKDYLLSQLNPAAPGAWRYFYDLPEIAPDIDDLGQIMQFLIRSGWTSVVDQHCQSAIDTCLNNNVLENGGIETWIIPRHHRTPTQVKQVQFNEQRWGFGPDVEVVANFLYALSIYQHATYQHYINKGIEYLVAQQEEKGFWKSRWYYGPFYASYTCLRLFRQQADFAQRYPQVRQKLLRFLQATQRTDAAWGIGKQTSDPLSTALAILCLYELAWPAQAFPRASLQRSRQFLQDCQNTNGAWPAVPFIKPRIDEPYQSVTLTTAYVLKALAKLDALSEV